MRRWIPFFAAMLTAAITTVILGQQHRTVCVTGQEEVVVAYAENLAASYPNGLNAISAPIFFDKASCSSAMVEIFYDEYSAAIFVEKDTSGKIISLSAIKLPTTVLGEGTRYPLQVRRDEKGTTYFFYVSGSHYFASITIKGQEAVDWIFKHSPLLAAFEADDFLKVGNEVIDYLLKDGLPDLVLWTGQELYFNRATWSGWDHLAGTDLQYFVISYFSFDSLVAEETYFFDEKHGWKDHVEGRIYDMRHTVKETGIGIEGCRNGMMVTLWVDNIKTNVNMVGTDTTC